MSAHSINAGKLVFLGVAALQQISANSSIIVFKNVQFWTEPPAESVYVKSGGAGPQSQRRGRSDRQRAPEVVVRHEQTVYRRQRLSHLTTCHTGNRPMS